MRTLIKGGTIVTAGDTTKADVLVEDEKVSVIGEDLGAKFSGFDSIIDATGKLVIPGGIDVHTHLDMPFGGSTSADTFESGTIAAACGGTTSIVDFAIQPMKPAESGGGRTFGSLREGLYDWHRRSEGKCAIDYAFHMIAREMAPRILIEMDALLKEEGVSSFKLFMAYPGVFMLDDQSIFQAMQKTAENGAMICMHAENGGTIDELIKKALASGNTEPKWHALTRPPELEAEATRRAIALARTANVPVYIVHLSAGEALMEVAKARDAGVQVFAETCPQYLFLSYDNYEEPGFNGAKYVMSPPLRRKGNEEALWRGLQLNDLQVISTDHCPFCMKEQKEIGLNDFSKIPNGAPGIETRMYLTYDGGVRTGRITANRWVEVNCTNPAKLFGLYPKKGTVAVGSDADLVIWDPNADFTIGLATMHSKVDYNPYEGRKVKGAPQLVLSRGKVIVVGNKYVGKPGDGRFIKRGPLQTRN